MAPRSSSESRSPSYSPSLASGGRRSRSISRSRSPPPPSPARRHLSRSPSQQRANRHSERSIEVSGISKLTFATHLESIFSIYGEIDDIVLPLFRQSGENRGRGHIVYRSPSSATLAEEHMDGGQIDGVIVSVRQAPVPYSDQQDAQRSFRRDRLESVRRRDDERDRGTFRREEQRSRYSFSDTRSKGNVSRSPSPPRMPRYEDDEDDHHHRRNGSNYRDMSPPV